MQYNANYLDFLQSIQTSKICKLYANYSCAT